MQVTLNIDDNLLSEIKREFHTENIEFAIKSILEQFQCRKGKSVASDINSALVEVKNGKTKPIKIC